MGSIPDVRMAFVARACSLARLRPSPVSADVALCRSDVSRACGDSDHDTWAAAGATADAAAYSTRSVYARWRLTEALLEHSIRDRAETALRAAAHKAATIEA